MYYSFYTLAELGMALSMMKNPEAKDSFFWGKYSLNISGRLHTIDRPQVMGILNITPDSFHDGGRYNNEDQIRHRIRQMLQEGADIIDIGAASTRPGAATVPAKEEIQRLKPALKILSSEFPEAIVSVDTWRAEVARAAADMGANMINDISGGTMDPEMIPTAGKLKLPYILMHIKGTPENMQENPQYDDVVMEVAYFLSAQMKKLLDAGANDIILDPGFGFGKNQEHNFQLLNQLDYLNELQRPLLVGVSRKRMICKTLGVDPVNALNGTTVIHTMALQKGAAFLRVHDVKEAVEAVKLVTFTQNLTDCRS